MTAKDLQKVDVFIQRYEKLPKSGSFKHHIMFGEPTQEEKREALKILDDIDQLFIDMVAFVKTRFGPETSYIMAFNRIDFYTEIIGIPIITNDRSLIDKAWRDGMSSLHNLLSNLRAEVKELVEFQPDRMELYQVQEKRRLTMRGLILFAILCFTTPLFFFILLSMKVLIHRGLDWQSQYLFIVFELFVLPLSILVYARLKSGFSQKFYQKYKLM